MRAFFDLYDAATQLGVLPGRGTLGEKALLVLRGFGLRSRRVYGRRSQSPTYRRTAGRNRPVDVIADKRRGRA